MGAIRELADRYAAEYFALDPITATDAGITDHDDRLTDFSPDGDAEVDRLQRRILDELTALERQPIDPSDEACARLLRERLEAQVTLTEHGDQLAELNVIASPAQGIHDVFELTATSTGEDWEVFGRRLEQVPWAFETLERRYRAGMEQGSLAAPRQVAALVEQLGHWSGATGQRPYFEEIVAPGPARASEALARSAAAATQAVSSFRQFIVDEYAPMVQGTPDAYGPERYARWARYYNGTDLDLDDGYAYGWSELLRIDEEMRREAERVLPGSTPLEAMRHLDEHGSAIDGDEVLREWLAGLIGEAMQALEGSHFDFAPELRKVESKLAPPGGAAAAYYTPPSEDFSRPGCTWYPTLGRNRFPTWELVTTWYHEGVPGHHLQLAQWMVDAPNLSRFQSTLGLVSANVEGWALYAERLMDELGFFADPGRRLGFLVGQQLRAVRVAVDIGMHLAMKIPTGQAFHPGETMTPELGRELLLAHAGSDVEMLESEWLRYLGWGGQAIGYKLGERVWLAGRDAARQRRGADFDLKAWHMAALRQGSLGLDDLGASLAAL